MEERMKEQTKERAKERAIAKSGTRNSSLELLRILAMLMIIACHFGSRVNWASAGHMVFNEYWLELLESLGQIGVGIFFLISGYFLYERKNFHWQRVFKIARPTWFYSWVILALAYLFHNPLVATTTPMSQVVAQSMFPIFLNSYWFISTYIYITLLSPYLKKWLDALCFKEIVAVVLLSFLFNTGAATFDFFLTSEFASIGGVISSTIIFVVMGYSLNRFKDKFSSPVIPLACILIAAIILLAGPAVLAALARAGYQNTSAHVFMDISSVPIALAAVGLFLVFSRFDFRSKGINYLASLMFGVYLIHENNFVWRFIWQGDLFHVATHLTDSKLHFVLYSFKMILVVFVCCAVIEAVRKFVVAAIMKVWKG
ncbi:acyltransferase [Atopobium sp. oral taxon 199]|uniref:acyltransferase n=1 Tax=Atopobium sp. oral taxon 199 TaxID=712156 RepID=UPI00034E86C4|nr:acyltransferase [Atopobium sp. oral taxon 199]EPD77539.1 hypothetical protein HMPREF1527_01472 [Atopobium sp. oral taxon 199 str. F0494]